MNLIVDVIEAYSHHIDLPIMLVNVDGNIDYAACDYLNAPLLMDEKQRNIKRMLKISEKLNSPTIMSVSAEKTQSDTFYIVTPIIQFQEQHFILVAGHFHIRNAVGDLIACVNNVVKNELDEYEVDELLVKMRNLYQIILARSDNKKKLTLPSKLDDVLTRIGNLNFNQNNDNSNIKLILHEYLNVHEIDFIGYATKNSNDVFVVTTVIGEQVFHLKDKKFYIGEGVLGKAAIYGDDFYWHTDENPKHNEFMHRYGVFPNNLFGFTLQEKGEVETIVFGGNFSNAVLDPSLNQFLKCIIQLTTRRGQSDLKLLDITIVQTLFGHWMEFVNATNSKCDGNQLIYKILDLCQALNFEHFSCVTTVDYEFIYRGQFNAAASELHQQASYQLKHNPSLKLWVNNNCVHYVVELGVNHATLFTVGFTKDTNMHYMTNIFEMIDKTINEQYLVRFHSDTSQDESIFDVLYECISDIDQTKSQLVDKAILLLQQLYTRLVIDESICNRLINISKVMTYGTDLLSKRISDTEEWAVLKHYKDLIESNFIPKLLAIEYQLLAFIDYVIFYNRSITYIKFIEKPIYDICSSIYNQTLDNIAHSIAKQAIPQHSTDEVTYIKDVISKLDLTIREKQVLTLLIDGMNNLEIGERLKISAHTVKNHVTNIFKKMDVSDRMQATAKVYKSSFVEII